MKYVTVRVFDSIGRPQTNAGISIYVHQFAAEGRKGPEYTNSNGEAEFELDIDDFAQISVYVNGNERVWRGSVKAEYRITV